MPLVSVIVPCRNGEPFVADAVRSLLSQDTDLEVIFVDDGSTDTSAKSVAALGDARVRIVQGPCTGVANVTNAALPHLTGEFVCRCDADDLYPPGRLAFQARWMSEHPEFAGVCGQFEMMTHAGEHVSTVGGGEIAEDVTDELLTGVTRTHFNTWMMRTSVLRELGGCRSWFGAGEDIDLMLRFPPRHRVGYEPHVWYRYRLHEGSITHAMPNNRRLFFEEWARTFAKQRRETGTDDLAQGKAPAPPEANGVKAYFADAHVQDLLIGRAWREHGTGHKGRALSIGMRACAAKPGNPAAWKNLVALVMKRAGSSR